MKKQIFMTSLQEQGGNYLDLIGNFTSGGRHCYKEVHFWGPKDKIKSKNLGACQPCLIELDRYILWETGGPSNNQVLCYVELYKYVNHTWKHHLESYLKAKQQPMQLTKQTVSWAYWSMPITACDTMLWFSWNSNACRLHCST